jgi:hypothetical protein
MTMISSAEYSQNAERAAIFPSGSSSLLSGLATLIVFLPLGLLGVSFLAGGKAVASLLFLTIADALLGTLILAAILALCAAGIAMRQVIFLFNSPASERLKGSNPPLRGILRQSQD